MLINIIIAFFLDMIFGDPRVRFHPVRLIGSMLTFFKSLMYGMSAKFLGGMLLVLSSMTTVFLLTSLLELLKRFFYLPFSFNLLTTALIYFLFCNRSMVGEARSVYRCLVDGELEQAREQLAGIVGRDTQNLDQAAVIRATVESISENIVDGFTAPLLYLVLGGVPCAYIYKTVNTIDSMFGYRNEEFELFGKFGARLDDVLNYLPARLNFFFLLCAVKFQRVVLKSMLGHGKNHTSPNSGIAEAGFAGYLGMALGGPSHYQGVLKKKPWIGENRIGPEKLNDPELIIRAISLYWRVVSVSLVFSLFLLYFFKLPLVFSSVFFHQIQI
jgi:adenosylcobinamide-phosphate synthase